MSEIVQLELRTSELQRNAMHQNYWQQIHQSIEVDPHKLAIIVCDVWDQHWSRGAMQRLDLLLPRMNQVLQTMREKGSHIIHAPSDTMSFYEDAPARQRIRDVSHIEMPPPLEHNDPPLPIDDSDGGSDTEENHQNRVWSRQHPALEIDHQRDVISDQGQEIYTYLQQYQIEWVALMGVHTNMCILNRSFAIKAMVRSNVNIVLIRDLTDSMYNPALPPYVSHDEGTQLVISYIEKFWCPSVLSTNLMNT